MCQSVNTEAVFDSSHKGKQEATKEVWDPAATFQGKYQKEKKGNKTNT